MFLPRLGLLLALAFVTLMPAQAQVGTYTNCEAYFKPEPFAPQNNNQWGAQLNTNFDLIDQADAGTLSLSVAGNSNVTLTSFPGLIDQARNRSFIFSGTLTGNITVFWPENLCRIMSVYNNTTGAFTLTIAVNNGSGSPAGATIAVPQGQIYTLASDGMNIDNATSPLLSDILAAAWAQGDILYYDGAHLVRLPAGLSGDFLETLGSGNNPQWAPGGGAGVTIVNNYITGFTLSNDVGTPNTKIDEAGGQAADSTNVAWITTNTTHVVNFLAPGANGLDTGSIAASTWYAILVINGTSGTAAMATKETAATAISPTMPSGYSVYRYVGSVKTDGSSHLLPFIQDGNVFYWGTQTLDFSSSLGTTSAVLVTLNTPLSVKTTPLIRSSSSSGTNNSVIFTSPDETDVAPANQSQVWNLAPGWDTGFEATTSSSAQNAPATHFVTDTSARIRVRSNTSATTVSIVTRGWMDPHVASVY